MNKYGILLDIIDDFILFFLRYHKYLDTSLSLIPLKPKRIEKILEAKYKNMIPKHILKKGSKENLDNFLNIIQKLLNKKRRLINASKQKLNMGK